MLATAAAAAASAAASRLLALTLLIDPFALSSPLTGSPCGDGCGECLPPVNLRTHAERAAHRRFNLNGVVRLRVARKTDAREQ